MPDYKSFASDNHAGTHPAVFEAMVAASQGDAPAYGDDSVTSALTDCVRRHFGAQAEPFVVFNGTAANILSLTALLRSYEGVVCAETAHINTDECGAPEALLGSKLLPVATSDGKLTPELVAGWLHGIGDQHHVQPRVVSISQSTELGTCYTLNEVRQLANYAHEHGMYLHIDGARLANAAVSLGCELADVVAGADVVSLGATKNGALNAEAVVVLRPELARGMAFVRKQRMQLASKMRFLSAQLLALFDGELWRANASHANAMARRLASGVNDTEEVEVCYPVEANAVFARLAPVAITAMQTLYTFHVWDEWTGTVRWMTSFDTEERHIDDFVESLRQAVKGTSVDPTGP